MTRECYDFLSESVLWDSRQIECAFAGCTEGELQTLLSEYREHCLQLTFAPAAGLGLAHSAFDGAMLGPRLLNRSVVYFDEVLLPDPVFALTRAGGDHLAMPGVDNCVQRHRTGRTA